MNIQKKNKPTNPSFIDITGEKFDRWTVIKYVGVGNGRKSYWECVCHCGNKKIVMGTTLTGGKSKSCGCYQKENSYKTHGMSKTAENKIYRGAKSRCKNKNNKSYKDYGGRGIKFLFKDFEEFYKELGPRPSNIYSLDRINNNGNYESGNVRWATRNMQNKNTRRNINIEYKGEVFCAAELDKKLGFFKGALRKKIIDQGYSHSDAIEFYLSKKREINPS